MKKLLFIAVLFCWNSLAAQIAPDTYYIQFTDKLNSPYSIDQPEQFLSERALLRRQKQQIAIDQYDLPVNPDYLAGVGQTGASILFPTKWFNGVTVIVTNQAILDAINQLPYVLSVKQLEIKPTTFNRKDKLFFANERMDEAATSSLRTTKNIGSFDYGNGYTQINQINGIPLHEDGFRGEGMVIALLDGGFVDADTHIAFDSIRNNGQLLGTKDFVHPGGNVYTESSHGTSVLSTIASNAPGMLIGTAPKASFWLLRSEYVVSEHLIEEYNWASAAEFADSVGVDIINSSLGYIDFDYPQWNHSYENMDGESNVVTIAADRAASRGILVVNSAGNSGGNSSYPYIGAPADGNEVFSIGAVTSTGERASFSSIGPTFDGRIKPDVMAMGQQTALANGNNAFTYGSGTSFSSPVIAGMAACLWQTKPQYTNMQIKAAITASGDRALNPDSYYGYGIPDFELAASLLTSLDTGKRQEGKLLSISPNPFVEIEQVLLHTISPVSVRVFDVKGGLKGEWSITLGQQSALKQQLNALAGGVYLLEVKSEEKIQLIKLIKASR